MLGQELGDKGPLAAQVRYTHATRNLKKKKKPGTGAGTSGGIGRGWTQSSELCVNH